MNAAIGSKTHTTLHISRSSFCCSSSGSVIPNAVCWRWRIRRCDLRAGSYPPSPREKNSQRPFLSHAEAIRFAIFAMVARLQPVAFCIVVQDCFAASMLAMLSLRPESAGRPLYLPSAFALAVP